MLRVNSIAEREERPSDKYRVPFRLRGAPVVDSFVGRSDILQQLDNLTIASPETGRRKLIVLHGLGGIGKTQIAIEHAFRNQDVYTAIFWLNGKSEDVLKLGLARIAEQIPLPTVLDTKGMVYSGEAGIQAAVTAVVQWLEDSENTSWLLILDNVDSQAPYDELVTGDNEYYDVRRFLPAASHGTILLTTRLSRLSQLGKAVSVGEINMIDGIQILRQVAGQSIPKKGIRVRTFISANELLTLDRSFESCGKIFRPSTGNLLCWSIYSRDRDYNRKVPESSRPLSQSGTTTE